jgi:SAM-dependent methyltransferase
LDIGCGTGLSTVALAAIAGEVVGVDPVEEMIAAAPRLDNVSYRIAPAEGLPFGTGEFDAVTVSSSLHWFDQAGFFAEARRVLRVGGWLANYDHYFVAEMVEDTAFAHWAKETYLSRFPAPPRGGHFDSSGIRPGFVYLGDDRYEDPIAMDCTQLVDYLLTQSNGIAATEKGQITWGELREWLTEELRAFFPSPDTSRTLRFLGVVDCLRAAAVPSGESSR